MLLRVMSKEKKKKKRKEQYPKFCDFSCKYAEFSKDTYCSVNITMYCKKKKQMIRKFDPCLMRKKKNERL